MFWDQLPHFKQLRRVYIPAKGPTLVVWWLRFKVTYIGMSTFGVTGTDGEDLVSLLVPGYGVLMSETAVLCTYAAHA